MRQSIKLLFLGIIIWGICSCNDTIDNGYEESAKISIYTDAKAAYSAVDVLYETGAPAFYGKSTAQDGPVSALGGFLSGFFDNESKEEAQLCDYSQRLALDATNIAGCVDEIWNNSYDAIARATTAIDNIPYTKELTDEQKSVLLAESSFFRAFNYFYLVKCFGGVPLIQSSEANSDKDALPRASVAEVYSLIVNDLGSAIPNLPDTAFTENQFRIARTTAETLLADVYLTMSGYPLRQDHFKNVAEVTRRMIRGDKHRLIAHGTTLETSAYNVLRTEDCNLEYIYSYRVEQQNVGESLIALSFSKNAAHWNVLKTKSTNNAYRPGRAYLNVYDSVYDMRMYEQQLFHTFYKYEKEGKTIIETFPQTSYMWFNKEAIQETGISKKDVMIYRYAEVLLMAAEAIAQSEGVTAEAVSYLADVRARAYSKADKNDMINKLLGLDKTQFIEEVWLERMREFPFEMKIWADIQRTRKYPLTSIKEKGTAVFTDIVGARNPWGSVFQEKDLLLPLSQNQLLKNTLLKQNPGYD